MDDYRISCVETIAAENGFRKPKLDVQPGSNTGENFASQLFRVEVTDEEPEDGNDRKLSLMVKVTLESEALRERMLLDRAFRNEANFYSEVLVTYADMLREVGLLRDGEHYPDVARCYLARANAGALDTLVLQDMRPEGFVMLSKRAGQDAAHCRQVLRALAHLHAGSLAAEHLQPQRFQRLREGVTELFEPGSMYAALFQPGRLTEIATEMIATEYPKGTLQFRKMEELCQSMPQGLFDLLAPCPEGGNVICYGDCWVNNILFKYPANDGRAPERVCLLDFQVSRYASPALDLSYYLFACTERETRDAHLHALLREYLAQLHARLRALGVTDPDALMSWTRLQTHLTRYARFAFVFGLISVPVFMAGAGEPDPETGLPPSDKTAARKRVAGILGDLVCRGYI